MASLNKVSIIGHLGSAPEVTTFESGSKVARFNVATTEKWTNKNGEKMEATEWHKMEVWGDQAEVAEKYLKKGSFVYVEGKLKTETFTDKDGIERQITRIRVTQFTMLDKKPTDTPATVDTTAQPATKPARNNAPAANRRSQAPQPVGAGGDDDLPF